METKKRLIYAEDLLKPVNYSVLLLQSGGRNSGKTMAMYEKFFRKRVEMAPTVDAVEVVRCRHCQYAKPYERIDGQMGYYCQHPKSNFLYGSSWERFFEPVREADDFCSYGERRHA